MDDSFTGIERFLSTESILDANKKGLLEIRRPVAATLPLSVDRHSIKKIEIAKHITSRNNPADFEGFRKQLSLLNDALSAQQKRAYQIETGRLFQ